MVFTRISTLGRQQQLLGNSFTTQSRLFEVQQQVSTGKISEDYKGIARDVLKLNSAKTIVTNKDQFVRNIDFAELRGRRNEFAVTTIADNVDTLRENMITVLGTGEPADFIPQVKATYESIKTILQTTENGKYIFSGSATDTPPWPNNFAFPADFLPSNSSHNNVELVDTNTIGATDELLFNPTGATTGTITINDADNSGNGWGTDVRVGARIDLEDTGGTFAGEGTYQITAYNPGANEITVELIGPAAATMFTAQTMASGSNLQVHQYATAKSIVTENMVQNTETLRVEADENQFLDYGLNAKEMTEELMILIAEIAQYDNLEHPNVPAVDAGTINTGAFGTITAGGIDFTGGDFNPGTVGFTMSAVQRQFIEDKLPQVILALEDTSVAATKNGLMLQESDRISERHEDDQIFLEEFITELEDVDMTEALADMQLAETALQASFQALSRVSSLNLMDFI